jgi:hypothetical protein
MVLLVQAFNIQVLNLQYNYKSRWNTIYFYVLKIYLKKFKIF